MIVGERRPGPQPPRGTNGALALVPTSAPGVPLGEDARSPFPTRLPRVFSSLACGLAAAFFFETPRLSSRLPVGVRSAPVCPAAVLGLQGSRWGGPPASLAPCSLARGPVLPRPNPGGREAPADNPVLWLRSAGGLRKRLAPFP